MDISKLQDAMSAYTKADVPDDAGGGVFKDMVTGALGETREALRAGEAQALAGAIGEGDITDLVFTLNEAEMKLKTIVSLRDRLVSSLQEIFRMPV